MSTENLTAAQALDEALDAIFGTYEDGWLDVLKRANREQVPDSTIINEVASVGALRRWSAPLLSIECRHTKDERVDDLSFEDRLALETTTEG